MCSSKCRDSSGSVEWCVEREQQTSSLFYLQRRRQEKERREGREPAVNLELKNNLFSWMLTTFIETVSIVLSFPMQKIQNTAATIAIQKYLYFIGRRKKEEKLSNQSICNAELSHCSDDLITFTSELFIISLAIFGSMQNKARCLNGL